jgi:hypothetical protein
MLPSGSSDVAERVKIHMAFLGPLGERTSLDVIPRSSSLQHEFLAVVVQYIHRAKPVFTKVLELYSCRVDST